MKTDGEEQTFTPTGTTKRLAPRRPSVDATSASIVFVGIVFAEIVSLRLFRFVFLARSCDVHLGGIEVSLTRFFL